MAITITRTTRTQDREQTHGKTNVALWVTQGALAALFLFAGATKLVMPVADMNEQMGLDLPGALLRFIGVCEILGAFGLVLPGISRIRVSLAALAAAGLVIIMAGATVLTAVSGDPAAATFPALVGMLCAFVTYGRTQVVAHREGR